MIDGRERFEVIKCLITANADSVSSLILESVLVPEEADICVQLPKLQQLKIEFIEGKQFLLSVVKMAIERRNDFSVNNMNEDTSDMSKHSTIKKLYIAGLTFDAREIQILFNSLPNIEELELNGIKFPMQPTISFDMTKLRKLMMNSCSEISPVPFIQATTQIQEIGGNHKQLSEALPYLQVNSIKNISLQGNPENNFLNIIQNAIQGNPVQASSHRPIFELLSANFSCIEELEIKDAIMHPLLDTYWIAIQRELAVKGIKFPCLKKLKLLEVHGSHISLFMQHFPKVEHLTIQAIHMEEFKFDETVDLSSVRKLFFIDSMPVEIGAILKKCPLLEELQMKDSDITVRDADFDLPNLKKLSIIGGRISEESLENLEDNIPGHLAIDLLLLKGFTCEVLAADKDLFFDPDEEPDQDDLLNDDNSDEEPDQDDLPLNDDNSEEEPDQDYLPLNDDDSDDDTDQDNPDDEPDQDQDNLLLNDENSDD